MSKGSSALLLTVREPRLNMPKEAHKQHKQWFSNVLTLQQGNKLKKKI